VYFIAIETVKTSLQDVLSAEVVVHWTMLFRTALPECVVLLSYRLAVALCLIHKHLRAAVAIC
jgi:hypothetical protein